MTATAATTFIAAKIPLRSAVPIAAGVAGLAIDTVSYCSQDPPADPGITAVDLFNAINRGNPLLQLQAVAKLQQWFLSAYWWAVCECTPPPTPTPPTPSNPGDIGIGSGVGQGIQGVPCWDVTQTYTLPGNDVLVDLTQTSLPATALFTLPSPGLDPPLAGTIPPGTTSLTSICNIDISVSAATPVEVDLITWNSSGAGRVATPIYIATAPGAVTHNQTLPAGATYWQIHAFNTGITSPPVQLNIEVSFFCSGTGPGQLTQPCCPPDAELTLQLARMQDMLTQIWESLPTALASYAEATVHAGLSGAGSFVLANAALAVKITLTTIPGWIGSEVADPTVYFDVGFVTAITTEAPTAGQRVTYQTQLFQLPALTESIGYTLNNGVVATITELVRGP